MCQAQPQASFRVENWCILRWKIGAFCGGFFCKNPLDIALKFSLRTETEFSLGPLELKVRARRILLSHTLFPDAQITSRCNYKNKWFFHVLFCPHLLAGFCLFEVRGVVVWALIHTYPHHMPAHSSLRIQFRPPPPIPEFLAKDFCVQQGSRMETLTGENLVRSKTALALQFLGLQL